MSVLHSMGTLHSKGPVIDYSEGEGERSQVLTLLKGMSGKELAMLEGGGGGQKGDFLKF